MHQTATWLEEVAFSIFFTLSNFFVQIVFKKTTWRMSFYCSHEYLTIICMNPISNAKLLNGQSVNVNAHHQHHRYSIGILCTRQRRSERDANEKCESLILNGFASIDCKSYINDMLRAGNKRLAEVVNVQQWQNDLPVCPFAGLHVLFCRCDRIIMIYKFGVVTVIVRSVRVPWHAKKKKKNNQRSISLFNIH